MRVYLKDGTYEDFLNEDELIEDFTLLVRDRLGFEAENVFTRIVASLCVGNERWLTDLKCAVAEVDRLLDSGSSYG